MFSSVLPDGHTKAGRLGRTTVAASSVSVWRSQTLESRRALRSRARATALAGVKRRSAQLRHSGWYSWALRSGAARRQSSTRSSNADREAALQRFGRRLAIQTSPRLVDARTGSRRIRALDLDLPVSELEPAPRSTKLSPAVYVRPAQVGSWMLRTFGAEVVAGDRVSSDVVSQQAGRVEARRQC